jgi:hypothetical protein
MEPSRFFRDFVRCLEGPMGGASSQKLSLGEALSSPGRLHVNLAIMLYPHRLAHTKVEIFIIRSIAQDHWRQSNAAPWPHLVCHNGPVLWRH